MARNANDVVAYETIKSSMADIDAACERMMTLAKNMSETIEDNIGSGKSGWDGISARAFFNEWSKFANETFPDAKQRLDTLVNDKMKLWETEFREAESSIEGTVSGVK